MKEAIDLYLEGFDETDFHVSEFIGVRRVSMA
jgi:hypothetical protein